MKVIAIKLIFGHIYGIISMIYKTVWMYRLYTGTSESRWIGLVTWEGMFSNSPSSVARKTNQYNDAANFA